MSAENIMNHLRHPYSRYGYAVTLETNNIRDYRTIHLDEIPQMLIDTIEEGLSHFRMKTDNNPLHDDVLKYDYIELEILRKNSDLIQSSGLSSRGMYLAPTILSTDGDAKGTFGNAESIIKHLKQGSQFLLAELNASRSFAPTTSKTNRGKASQSPPSVTLFEAACSTITTITPYKPAFLLLDDMSYTGIIPDLSLHDLIQFVSLFRDMQLQNIQENLNERKIHKDYVRSKTSKKDTNIEKKKEEFKRPRLHDGNYPYAPYDSKAFGVIGIVAALGKWASKANKLNRVREIFISLLGDENHNGLPLYVVSYDKIRQVQLSHHIAQLAIENEKLSIIINSLTSDTILYSELDSKTKRYENQNYALFNMMASRFLQQFNEGSLRDFLSFRAEYSQKIQPLFDRYFMSEKNISHELVQSARAFGQWINYAAYKAADDSIDAGSKDRYDKVQKEKAKILADLESTILSSKNELELLSRISIRIGRFLNRDLPSDATLFMDAVASRSIDFDDAKNLLLAYSRLSNKKFNTEPNNDVVHDNETNPE